jgi:hypothetical protein
MACHYPEIGPSEKSLSCLRVETCSEIKVKSKPKVLNLLVDIFATSLTKNLYGWQITSLGINV